MTIKATGRATLILATGILATGFFVCLAGPSQAAVDAEDATVSSESAAGAPVALNRYAKQGPRHWRSQAHRKSPKLVKSSATKKAADVADADGDNSTAIPALVANANAQMIAADTPAGNGKAMSARANDILQAAADNPTDTQPSAETQIVSADQLNDVDRALQESKPIAATFAMASADTAATAGSDESSTWDRTSLIGKIFIGLGVLLTMASAARMFMA